MQHSQHFRLLAEERGHLDACPTLHAQGQLLSAVKRRPQRSQFRRAVKGGAPHSASLLSSHLMSSTMLAAVAVVMPSLLLLAAATGSTATTAALFLSAPLCLKKCCSPARIWCSSRMPSVLTPLSASQQSSGEATSPIDRAMSRTG